MTRFPLPRRELGDLRLIEAVGRHVERHVGPIDFVYHETDSRLVHVDVHHVPPDSRRPFHTLVTSGMSQRAMNVPPGGPSYRHAELFALLPRHWRLDLEDGRWSWPIRELRDLARYPHQESTWLGCGHTVQNGRPPAPYDRSTGFCASILTRPVSLSGGFARLRYADRRILFYQFIPIYEEELRFALQHTSNALLARFAQYEATDVIDTARPNVCNLRLH
jgi:hypothetical protein